MSIFVLPFWKSKGNIFQSKKETRTMMTMFSRHPPSSSRNEAHEKHVKTLGGFCKTSGYSLSLRCHLSAKWFYWEKKKAPKNHCGTKNETPVNHSLSHLYLPFCLFFFSLFTFFPPHHFTTPSLPFHILPLSIFPSLSFPISGNRALVHG